MIAYARGLQISTTLQYCNVSHCWICIVIEPLQRQIALLF